MAADFTSKDRELMNLLLEHGLLFPPEFKDRVAGWILDALREMPKKQIPGLALMGVRDSGKFGTAFNTTGPNSNYITNPNPGFLPHKVTGVADGRYLIWRMGAPQSDYHMQMAINGETVTAAAGDPSSIYGGGGSITFALFPQIRNLKNDNNNTVEMVYRDPSAGATSTDGGRLTLIRLGPPL